MVCIIKQLWKEVLNPALVIYDPRDIKAQKVSKPVQLLDVVKTALDWGQASAEDKAKSYGDTLIPILTNEGEFARDYAVGECPGYYAIVTERYKYIAPFDYQKDGKIVLFDLQENPEETINIADQNPELVARFKEKAAKWAAKSGEVMVQALKPPKKKKTQKVKKAKAKKKK